MKKKYSLQKRKAQQHCRTAAQKTCGALVAPSNCTSKLNYNSLQAVMLKLNLNRAYGEAGWCEGKRGALPLSPYPPRGSWMVRVDRKDILVSPLPLRRSWVVRGEKGSLPLVVLPSRRRGLRGSCRLSSPLLLLIDSCCAVRFCLPQRPAMRHDRLGVEMLGAELLLLPFRTTPRQLAFCRQPQHVAGVRGPRDDPKGWGAKWIVGSLRKESG